MIRTMIICCWCWLAVSTLSAQALAWENIGKDRMANVLIQLNDWFKNTPNYAVTVTHTSFETYTTTVPYEKSVGYFKKDRERYHSFLLGIHTFQNAAYKIVVDTANQTMLVANVEPGIWNAYDLEGYTYLLNSCSGIKTANSGSDKKYRLEYGIGHPLERYEFLLAPDGSLKEVAMYYRNSVPKNPDNPASEKVTPRLNITFSGYKKGNFGMTNDECDEKKFFIKKGNKLLPTGKYRNFNLIDQRLSLN